MIPELKRALIKCVPDYFAWNIAVQEQYRVNTPKEDVFKIRQYLLKILFGISVADNDELDTAWDELSIEQYTVINPILLPLQGIGEDYFYLNECLADDKTLLSFPTLYDYDFDNYQFQEESRVKESKDYRKKPYRGSLYFTWARLLVDGAFSYGVLSMVAGYIYSQVDEFGNDYIGELIPYSFKKGKDHGKKDGAGYLWNMKRDARGLESQLDALLRRFWQHLQKVYERLLDEYHKKSEQRVFIIDSSKYGDREHQFLFTDTTVLQRIRLQTFMRNCCAVEQKNQLLLTQKIEGEKNLMKVYLDSQYKDIMVNFDPKMLKFQKKRKIFIHKDSGLDELL